MNLATYVKPDGHQVIGLVRTEEKARAFATAGGTPLGGSLGDLDTIRAAARDADGIVHTASASIFGREPHDPGVR